MNSSDIIPGNSNTMSPEEAFMHDPLGFVSAKERMPTPDPKIQLQRFIEGFYPAGYELDDGLWADLDCYANDERRAIHNAALIMAVGAYDHLTDVDEIDGALLAAPEELEGILAPWTK